MEEHAQQSSDTTYVVIPKKEIDEELEITFEKEYQDNQLIVPKVEFGDELSDNFDELDDINLSNPMKRERMLSEEFIIPKEEIITDQLLDDYDSEHHDDSLIKPIKVELMLSEEIVKIRQKDSEVEKKTDLTQTSKSSDKRQ
ncbi:jg451, partial [Pararge aegeria aegeria]